MPSIPRLYLSLAGEEDALIRQCKGYAQHVFRYIRFHVLLLFVGCWISAAAFMYYLFQGNKWMAFPVGVIWALLVTNMYLLLLHTVTPALLPVKDSKLLDKARSFFTVAMLFRLVFMSLLAVMIAQPINVLVLKPFARKSLDTYKTEYRAEMMLAADSALIAGECRCGKDLHQTELQMTTAYSKEAVAERYAWLHRKIANDSLYMCTVKLLLDSLTHWHGRFSDHWKHISDSTRLVLDNQLGIEQQSDSLFLLQLQAVALEPDNAPGYIQRDQLLLQKLVAAKVDNYHRLLLLMNRSNFYIKINQILLSENPFSWLITLLVIGLFLYPIYLKYSIRNKGTFYQKKEAEERGLVMEDYRQFKQAYRQAFVQCIESYNAASRTRVIPWLEKLKQMAPDSYTKQVQQWEEVLKEEVEKYEYWADHPFRTLRRKDAMALLEEEDLLTLIYPATE